MESGCWCIISLGETALQHRALTHQVTKWYDVTDCAEAKHCQTCFCPPLLVSIYLRFIKTAPLISQACSCFKTNPSSMCFTGILQQNRKPVSTYVHSFNTHMFHRVTVHFIYPTRSFKPIFLHAPAPHSLLSGEKACRADMVPLSPGASAWYEVTNGRLADLPLQRLSHTHRGWQTAIDGSWSLPPGDVSAGCQTDTPDTWTASAGGAALVPAPRYHGSPPCNETPAHLVKRGSDPMYSNTEENTPKSTVRCLGCCHCCALYLAITS